MTNREMLLDMVTALDRLLGTVDDNPPITCPYCGSTDQEYIYAGEWICGDCNERWNERTSTDSHGDEGS